jgi:hypothetical protein
VVLPDGNGQLSDGVVVEARLKARLLGAPVLRVDGTVVVSPGRVVDVTPGERVDGAVARGKSSQGPGSRGTPSLRAPGGDLARAARLMADTDGCIASWNHRQASTGGSRQAKAK